MDQPFVEYILTKIRNFSGDIETMTFKITMEIHSCHEKVKRGIRSEEDPKSGAHMLLDYYKNLAGSNVPILKKYDTTFVDAWDVVRVYSVQLDETFPLLEYPYRLFNFYAKNLGTVSDYDKENIEKINKLGTPKSNRGFVKIYTILANLSSDTKKKLMINSFFDE